MHTAGPDLQCSPVTPKQDTDTSGSVHMRLLVLGFGEPSLIPFFWDLNHRAVGDIPVSDKNISVTPVWREGVDLRVHKCFLWT